MQRRFWFLYLHPFLWGIYPVLAMLGHNIVQVYQVDALRPLAIMVGVTGLLWGALWLGYRNWARAGLATSFLLFLYLLYVNLPQAQDGHPLWGVLRAHPEVVGGVLGGVAVLGLVGVWRGARLTRPLTQLFFIVGIVAVFFPVSQIVSYDVTDLVVDVSNEEVENIDEPVVAREGYPDIYFIVLDSYAREDVLNEVFNFNNAVFLTELEKLGFYVPQCNQSNYSKTAFSIASTLNLDYLDVLGEGEAKNALMDRDIIRDNEVRRLLAEWGYETVAFPTGYSWSEISDAEIFLKPDEGTDSEGGWEPLDVVNPFEALLLRSSFRPVLDLLYALEVGVRPNTGNQSLDMAIQMEMYQQAFERTHFALDALEEIPELPSPKFVYAHIVSPHSPYVMNRYGAFALNQDHPKHGYIEQVTYLNSRVLSIIKRMLAQSSTPPIIILEGDHGAKAVEWTPDIVKNLSAYYFPGDGDQRLYNAITPINAFRILFDYYFDTDLGTVEDLSYRSLSDAHQLDMELVPNTCGGE